MARGASSTRGCPGFLDLPGELRNSIYELVCRENSAVSPTGARFFRIARPKAAPRTSSLALAQVCRQTRSEYRDMALTSGPIIVHLHQINRLLDTFFPMDETVKSTATSYRGDIQVLLSTPRNPCKIEADLLPVVNTCLAAPNLSITFLGGSSGGPWMRNETRSTWIWD